MSFSTSAGAISPLCHRFTIILIFSAGIPRLVSSSQRCEELTSRGIPAEKISIIVNRWHKGEIAPAEVEKLMKYPVAAVFGNDYRSVSSAAKEHLFVCKETKV